jgi:signal transduction histidine kinase
MAELADATYIAPSRGARGSAWTEEPDLRRRARQRRVARDLVELSRLQRGGERAERIPVDLAHLVHTICSDYAQTRVAGPDTLVVPTDSRRLSRVLMALLDNAHLHGGSPVEVRYDRCAILVCDGGCGFSPALLARATEPFVTGDRSRGRGIGLGLAIASRQAALLGVELELGNAVGGGATARLCFSV